MSVFRIYEPHELDDDSGYPWAWVKGVPTYHTTTAGGAPKYVRIADMVRNTTGSRCQRCLHPYVKGDGRWSKCDEQCKHGMPARDLRHPFGDLGKGTTTGGLIRDAKRGGWRRSIEAEWRILTVHHLNNDKADCRWWNLVALCQRCHLNIQRRVVMDRVYIRAHSEWFKPYAAAFYANKYLEEDLTREEVMARMDELLALELSWDKLEGWTRATDE